MNRTLITCQQHFGSALHRGACSPISENNSFLYTTIIDFSWKTYFLNMDPSRTGSESGRSKPKLFSMSRSRALLESKRLNTLTTDSSNIQRDRAPLQNPARILTSFLDHPARVSTPTHPRCTYEAELRIAGDENCEIFRFLVSTCCLSS